jgi:ATP-dependent Clp protease ATP-binding subunit ClpA
MTPGAQMWAKQLKTNTELLPAHLLLSIAARKDSAGFLMLKKLAIDEQKLIEGIKSKLGNAKQEIRNFDLPPSALTKRVLDQSVEIAKNVSMEFITSSILLVAILEVDESMKSIVNNLTTVEIDLRIAAKETSMAELIDPLEIWKDLVDEVFHQLDTFDSPINNLAVGEREALRRFIETKMQIALSMFRKD